MSEQWPASGSEQPTVEPEAIGWSSANGAPPGDVDDVPDGLAAVPVPMGDERADPPSTAAAVDEEGSAFLAELVRAMQTTASLERVRINDEAERRRQAHIDGVRAREASEADRMRELAGEDRKAIEAWADAEAARIQAERQRREAELDQDLETSLAEHHARIDREIEGVEAAVATYRAEVGAFFEGLDRETDPVRIAQQALRRPAFPTLEAAGETAVAAADVAEAEPPSAEALPAETDEAASGVVAAESGAEAAESGAEAGEWGAQPAESGAEAAESGAAAGEWGAQPAVVGVMDPAAAGEPVESWATPPATGPDLAPAGASDDVEQVGEAGTPTEEVAAASGPRHGGGGLLASVPVLRPMSWLRRDANGDDRSTGDQR